MASETSAVKAILNKYCIGEGLDIGCGAEKIVDDALGIDFEYPYMIDSLGKTAADFTEGWQDFFEQHQDVKYDYIYSSHLLEDFQDYKQILEEWIRHLNIGGHLILMLPIEHKYRQYCEDNNHPYNQAHHNEWSGANDFISSLPLSLFNQLEVIETNDNANPYSFYVVFKRKQYKQCILYLTYNSAHAARVMLPRLLLFRTGDTDILAVDNNSIDDTVKVLEDLGIEVIKSETNVGYSAGINIGLKEIINRGYDWVIIINPDIGAYVSWDEKIFENVPQDANIIGCKMMDSNNDIHHAGGDILSSPLQQCIDMSVQVYDTEYSVFSKVPYSATRLTHRISHNEQPIPELTPWVTFAVVAIKVSLLSEIGLLNEEFFLYNSDSEFCLRAWASDRAVYYNPIEFFHAISGSSPRHETWLLETVTKDAMKFREIEETLIERGKNKWHS